MKRGELERIGVGGRFGAVGVGALVARWPVSDRMVGDVAETIEANSGQTAPTASVRASIERDRERLGLRFALLGAVVIGVACGSL